MLARHEVNLAEFTGHDLLEITDYVNKVSRPRFGSLGSVPEFVYSPINDAVVIIDEFTHWVRAEPRVVSELRRFVDHVMPRTRLMIVLVGIMYRDVLGSGDPLYGRAGFRLRVDELEPWHMPQLHPWLSRDDWVRVYALLGGAPYYHALVGECWGVNDMVRKLFP